MVVLLGTVGIEDWMLVPGAIRSTTADILVKEEIPSDLVEDPTVTALEMHPGWLTVEVELSLPAAIAVSTPAALRLSIEGFWESPSQLPEVFGPPPRLMLAEATLMPPASLILEKT